MGDLQDVASKELGYEYFQELFCSNCIDLIPELFPMNENGKFDVVLIAYRDHLNILSGIKRGGLPALRFLEEKVTVDLFENLLTCECCNDEFFCIIPLLITEARCEYEVSSEVL